MLFLMDKTVRVQLKVWFFIKNFAKSLEKSIFDGKMQVESVIDTTIYAGNVCVVIV